MIIIIYIFKLMMIILMIKKMDCYENQLFIIIKKCLHMKLFFIIRF